MSEEYRRIQSYELALTAVMAHIDRHHILGALVSIGEALLQDIGREERSIRLRAILLLNDALEHLESPAMGLRWRD